MPYRRPTNAVVLWMLAPCVLFSAEAIVPASVTVGRNLQVSTRLTLKEQAPFSGLEVTLTSDDPGRLRFSKRPDGAGSPSIVLEVNPGVRQSPEFWVQGFSDSGDVTYTAAAPGFGSSKGTVTLTPSAIVIIGPFKTPKFPTTPRAGASRITIHSARLDSSLKFVEQQAVAGGMSAKVTINGSNPAVGTLATSQLSIAGGYGGASTQFQPLAMGESTFSLSAPPGFSTPAEFATVTAMVVKPGLGITDQVAIGENLQIAGVLGLGQAPPPGGVKVTLTSDDPDKLLLSATATDQGAKSITITIPEGNVNSPYYLQALGKTGTATYTATASEYRNRTATITLAPSGVVITPRPYGPPDEAELLRKDAAATPRGFVLNLSKPSTMPLVVWTVQLDPETLRSADITVQPLRAGLSLPITLTTSNPAVGALESTVVTISGGSDSAGTQFKPLSQGSTTLSVVTPKGFTTSANSTSVPAIVRE